jgi:hypothetical protein
MAASSWSLVHSGAWANTSPVDGFTTWNVLAAATVSPPMVMVNPFMT